MRLRGLTRGRYCLNLSGIMSVLKKALPVILIALFVGYCSVISQHIRTESISPIDLKILLQEPNKYKGETVILGGYILETDNLTDQTIIKVLQAPLGARDEPKSRDYSEGRFIVSQKGFLDPEIYSKDRKITVAGTVVGSVVEKVNEFSHPYLKIQSREIYLWPKDQEYPPAPYYEPWFYPYPFYWYPYRHYYPYYWYHHHPYYW
jgi:outer membrane lipoprotein